MTDSVKTISSESPLHVIKDKLDALHGVKTWASFEPETLALDFPTSELGSLQLFIDKLYLLKILETSPMQPFEDPVLFAHAAEVINNQVADFNQMPYINLLEAAYAIFSIAQVLQKDKVVIEYPNPIKKVIEYIHNNEGASEPIPPMTFIDKDKLSPGQTKEDSFNKKKAVVEYITHMESL